MLVRVRVNYPRFSEAWVRESYRLLSALRQDSAVIITGIEYDHKILEEFHRQYEDFFESQYRALLAGTPREQLDCVREELMFQTGLSYPGAELHSDFRDWGGTIPKGHEPFYTEPGYDHRKFRWFSPYGDQRFFDPDCPPLIPKGLTESWLRTNRA